MKWKALACAVLLTCALCVQSASGAEVVPETSASAVVVADGMSGRVLYEKNGDEQRLIASTTKLLTAYTAVQLCEDLDQTVTVSWTAATTEGSSMYLKPGEEISVEDLLWGMLLVSGNDAAVAVAEGCCESQEAFVSEMNRIAGELGMCHSHFENPSGLDGQTHYSTANDLAILARHVLEEPLLAEIVGTKSAVKSGHSLVNHNKLLTYYPFCTGLKTGYTQHAGRTLVSSAERDGKRLIIVTLNDSNDWKDHQALYEHFFGVSQLRRLASCGQSLGRVRRTGSLGESDPLYAQSDVTCLLCRGEQVRRVVTLNPDNQGKENEIAGTARWYIGDVLVGETELGKL